MSYFLDKVRIESIESWAEHCKNKTSWQTYQTIFKSFFIGSSLLHLVLSIPGILGIMLIIGGLFGHPRLILAGILFPLMSVLYFATEVAMLVDFNKEKSKTNDS